jgi:glycosyltransferase involved in cell wall biosynthesis
LSENSSLAITSFSVVIPALNEEKGIGDTVLRLIETVPSFEKLGVVLSEVIVVDDGSTDHTPKIVASLNEPRVRLISHNRRRGYGAALKTGFLSSDSELLGFLDADGTYPAEEFPFLCQSLLETNADLVVGSRRSGKSSQMPFLRRAGNLLWSGLVSLFSGKSISDPASGMRVFRRSALVGLDTLPDGLNFTPIMTTRSVHEGLNLLEVPIPYEERAGDSKLSVLKDGTRFLKTIIWALLEYNPAGILGLMGGLSLAVSLAIGLVLIGLRIQGITDLNPLGVLSVFCALVGGVAGVSILALAVIFDRLVGLFHHQNVRKTRFSRMISPMAQGRRLGWFGLFLLILGSGVAVAAVSLGLRGWPLERLWLWLTGSSLFLLVGIQLLISWSILRVLEALRERFMPRSS